ncbi:hypothetical protein KY317_00775 [Candidatus Woesearchaeota archaeon]|nr:hypothetical protein [Candidatus Woesearchaeota archaeon]
MKKLDFIQKGISGILLLIMSISFFFFAFYEEEFFALIMSLCCCGLLLIGTFRIGFKKWKEVFEKVLIASMAGFIVLFCQDLDWVYIGWFIIVLTLYIGCYFKEYFEI